MQTISPDVFKQAWASSSEDILEQFGVSIAEGLHKRDVRKLRKVHGLNALRKIKEKSAWRILLEQLKSLIVVLLCGAAVLSFALKEWMDGVAILVVIFINTAIGFLTELKAIRSMESLRRMERITARVRRSGQIVEIPASQLVPGDIVVIEGGDVVSADLRLIRTSKLQIDESMLTGESLAVSKQCERIAEDVVLAERTNMLFKGTAVTRGSGEGIVVATGMSTELGKISALVAEAQPSVAPLERRLDELGRRLLCVTLAVIVLVAAAGIARGKDVVIMIEMAIALAVAAIPEGLPIVATVALARGMLRMARRSALVNRLAAVETLGGTSVICTDKTGTLTENRMTVTRIVLSTGEIDLEPPNAIADRFTSDVEPPQATANQVLLELLEVAALCNNAFLSEAPEGRLKGVGDPLEVALLLAAANAGIQRKDLNNRLPETREEAFDSDLKMMATFHRDKGRYRVAVKGAPEVVLEVCSCVRTDEGLQRLDEKTRQRWGQWNAVMAERGLRVSSSFCLI